ncbi:MAG: hypothetical protein HQL64_08235 [Magnetococcales bacterium]|nr:hypothetical protein [Magnetococcales bacterium]
MSEAQKTAKADALRNKAKLQQMQAEARARTQRIKNMMQRPKPPQK